MNDHKETGERRLAYIKPPTDIQRRALLQLAMAKEPISSFHFGSTTVNVLRKRGWAENVKVHGITCLNITEAGREALK